MSTLVSSMTNSQTQAPLLHNPIAMIICTQIFMHRTCHTHEPRHCHPLHIFGFKSRKTQNITNFALFYDFTKSYTFVAKNKSWIQPLLQRTKSTGKNHDFTKWYLTFLFPLAKNVAPLESSFQLFICILLLEFPPHNTSTQRSIKSLSVNTHVEQQTKYRRIGVMAMPLLATITFLLQKQIAKKVTITSPCSKTQKNKTTYVTHRTCI